jgi:hypothetical protein
MDTLKLNAAWTDDCSGKKSYDGDILSVSSRYWPRTITDRPSATSCFIVNHGGESDDYETITEMKFEGDSLADVKAQVEVWAQAQMNRAVAALRREFDHE